MTFVYYDLLTSEIPETKAGVDPCYAFSVHKCGSTLMHSMIKSVCSASDIPSTNVPTVMHSEGILPRDWGQDVSLLKAFGLPALHYGFRFLPPSLASPKLNLKSRRTVLLVRDPRDALVSQYFSYGKKDGSHVVPQKMKAAMERSMERNSGLNIDEYVLQEAPKLSRKLEAYRRHLNFENCLVCRYEDVYFDKQSFLAEIFTHFGIDVPANVIVSTAAEHDVRPAQEDPSRHIRKGTPGDHAEKLQPETISALNDLFRDIGAFYCYAF